MRLGLAFRVVVQSVQVVCAHLLHVGWVVLEFAARTVRHGHVFEHLLLGHRNMTTHGTRSVLVHRHHLGRTRALVADDFVGVALRLIHIILRGTELRGTVRVEKSTWLVTLILLQMVHQLLARVLRILDCSPHVALG